MNKKEIYEYLNYNGKYTKEIEKKLKKLIKKYHPDKNKNDKSTILVLYEVKKELENNVVNRKYYRSFEPEKQEQEKNSFNHLEPFIKRMIDILKIKKERKEKEIAKVQKKVNYHYNKRMDLSNSKNKLDLELDEISKKYNSSFNRLWKVLFMINLICLFIFMLFSNLLSFLVFILSIFCTIIYFFIRHEYFKELDKIIVNKTKEKERYEVKIKSINDKINDLEKVCVNLKFERNAISNDIQFYNYELSKILSSSYSLVKEEERSYKKSI